MSATGWIAAHSPDTAEAGQAVLRAGGSAADAAAAMTLAACVAEPLVVSLLSGMHAIHATPEGRVSAVDGFVDVPAVTDGGRTAETEVVFADERVPYTIGGATFGVPGLVAGCAALHADHGRLPWADVVAPARRLADSGVELSAQDEALLVMLEPVMTIGVGGTVFRHADGRLKGTGDRVVLPGIGPVLDELADDGPSVLYSGRLGRARAGGCAAAGARVDVADLAAMRPVRHTPPAVDVRGHVVRSRRGLSPLTDWLDALARRPLDEHPLLSVVAVQGPLPQHVLGTTSLAVVDGDGGACAVTASLGLGTGDWFHGSQLNSMLGEVDLQRGPLRPRARMGSMMAPIVIEGPDGVVAALGAAGGSRIPSAVLRVAEGILRGLDPVAAVELPRAHRIGHLVHVEPHLPDEDVDRLTAVGYEVVRWQTRNHFFGGVSVATPDGAEGDPRRGGAAGPAHP
ncbi:gamma-glutamyltransferase [Euzebya sp.]|uniref:gamma-glutamyltransferase n=1 Tax=Euzebya sp. TaxID=1971409 RepID=UPI00351966C0